MAKRNRTICLSLKINEKLDREPNASVLIEQLLNNYYGNFDKVEIERVKAKADEKERLAIKEADEIFSRGIVDG